jgi:hypothetical protein
MSALAAIPVPPKYIRPNFERIPAELKLLKNWLLWGAAWTGSKWRKRPIQVSGYGASTTHRKHWSSFDDVKQAFECCNQRGYIEVHERNKPPQRIPIGGVGFVFDGQPDEGGLVLAGVDFDSGALKGEFLSFSAERVKRLGSYVERSVSGTGLHVILKAHPLDRGIAYSGIEMYTSGRFFAMTGCTEVDPRPIIAAPTEFAALAEELQKQAGNRAHQANLPTQKHNLGELTAADRERIKKYFGHLRPRSLAEGLETNIEEIRSAVSAIPPAAISTEPEWMRFGRGLAHEAAVYENQAEQLWEILDAASRHAPGYNEEDNRSRWIRYISEAFNRENPITIATVFELAKKHGWQGWSPPVVATASVPMAWSATELKVSLSNIPHRQWLYGFDLIRGELTVIGSPGGVGKSSLAIGMAISIATDRELLEEKVRGGDDLEVLLINAEDSGTEIRRRVWAFYLAHAHKIAGQNLDRLYVVGADDERVQHLSFLRTDKNVSVVDQDGFKVLEAAFESLRPDVIILDPLVAFCGGGNMNDNTVMSLVMRELKRLAVKFNCAILVVHHTRKGGDAGNAESISGAASIVNLARRAIMPVPMTEDEVNKTGVLPSERLSYFKLVDAKSNLAPRLADSAWYKLHSIELPNPEPPLYPHGDNVQAITRANLPLSNNVSAAGDDLKVRRALLNLVAGGKIIDGRPYPYSPSIAGAKNERAILDDAMAAVVNAMAPQQWSPADLEAVTKRTIEKMETEGWLVVGDMKELMSDPGRFRKGRGLKVDWARTPWPTTSSAGGTAASDGT